MCRLCCEKINWPHELHRARLVLVTAPASEVEDPLLPKGAQGHFLHLFRGERGA